MESLPILLVWKGLEPAENRLSIVQRVSPAFVLQVHRTCSPLRDRSSHGAAPG